MKEQRIYLADLNTWYNSSMELDNVIECAESQGCVWTLEQFVRQFNNGEMGVCNLLADSKGDVVMAVATVEDGVIVEGVVR